MSHTGNKRANLAPGELTDEAGSGRQTIDITGVSCEHHSLPPWHFSGRGTMSETEIWALGQEYRARVAFHVGRYKPNRILEIGPLNLPICLLCHTVDKTKWYGYEPTYLFDVTEAPWPLEDNSYDIIIASEVFEHLWPDQNVVFRECMRVAPVLVMVVPYRWEPPLDDPGHEHIDEETLRGWCGRYPQLWELISDHMSRDPDGLQIKLHGFDATRRWHRILAIYERGGDLRQARWSMHNA